MIVLAVKWDCHCGLASFGPLFGPAVWQATRPASSQMATTWKCSTSLLKTRSCRSKVSANQSAYRNTHYFCSCGFWLEQLWLLYPPHHNRVRWMEVEVITWGWVKRSRPDLVCVCLCAIPSGTGGRQRSGHLVPSQPRLGCVWRRMHPDIRTTFTHKSHKFFSQKIRINRNKHDCYFLRRVSGRKSNATGIPATSDSAGFNLRITTQPWFQNWKLRGPCFGWGQQTSYPVSSPLFFSTTEVVLAYISLMPYAMHSFSPLLKGKFKMPMAGLGVFPPNQARAPGFNLNSCQTEEDEFWWGQLSLRVIAILSVI